MQTQDRIPFDRLLAVDLRGLSKEQMDALSKEAITRGIPFSQLLGELIAEMSRRITQNGNPQAA